MARTTPPRPLDVETLFPEVASYRKTVVRLHPRLGDPSARESSLGGPVLWPLSEPWPHCEDDHPRTAFSPPAQGPIPLVPVLQLFAADVPDLAFPSATDLLQVLWCPFDHEDGYVARPEIYWRDGSLSDLQPANRPRPTGADNDYLPDPCVLHPERVTDYPNWDLPDEVADALEVRFEQLEEETGWSYWSHLSVSDGVKVGGYPTWTQEPNWPTCPTCRVRMEHLLTISSNEFDGESWRTWLPIEDTPAMGTIWDLPYEQRTEIQCPPWAHARRHGRHLPVRMHQLLRQALRLPLRLFLTARCFDQRAKLVPARQPSITSGQYCSILSLRFTARVI